LKKFRGKAAFFLFLLILGALTVFAVRYFNKARETEITSLEIINAGLLTPESYEIFARDSVKTGYPGLEVLSGRLKDHPYIEDVTTEFSAGRARIYLKEKKIAAILIKGETQYMITANAVAIKLLEGTLNIDYPVIVNPAGVVNDSGKITEEGVLEALEIIKAAKYIDERFGAGLSDINLRNGGEKIISFSFMKPQVIFGNGDVPRKMLRLYSLLSSEESDLKNYTGALYLDLRYDGLIFAGKMPEKEDKKDEKKKVR